METFFISTANLQHLLGNLVKKNLLYAPRKKGDFLFYEKIETASPKDLGKVHDEEAEGGCGEAQERSGDKGKKTQF